MWLNGPSDEAKRAGGRLRPIRPVGAIRSHVRVQARPAPRARRVRGARHRDQRVRRRPLRDDRGGRRAGGRRGAPRDLRLARAGGAPALARDPALHRDHAGHGGRRAAAGGGAGRAGRPARGPRADRAQRALRRARAAPGVRARRARLARAARALHRAARAPLRPARAQAGARAAGRLARDRGGRGAPRAARRPHVRARVLRPVPEAVRERRDGGRRARPAALAPPRSQDRAGRGDPARPAAGPLDAAGRPGRLRLPRRARAAAVRGEVGVAALARAGALLCPRGLDRAGARSWTTGRRTRSSARSCSRTG